MGFGTPVPEEFDRAADDFDRKMGRILEDGEEAMKKAMKSAIEKELKKLDGKGGGPVERCWRGG